MVGRIATMSYIGVSKLSLCVCEGSSRISVHRVRTRKFVRVEKRFNGMGLTGFVGIWPSIVCVRAMAL